MRHFTISIDIDAPPARVWDVMSDVERWHEWTPSVTSVRRREQGPLVVGSRAVIRQPKLLPASWKVTAIERGHQFAWVNGMPGLRVVGQHSVSATPAGSRATLSLDFEGLLGGIVARRTRGISERYLALEARGLKARSENPAFTHDGRPGRPERPPNVPNPPG